MSPPPPPVRGVEAATTPLRGSEAEPDEPRGVVLSYADGAGRAARLPSRRSVLVFIGIALALTALRVVATVTAARQGSAAPESAQTLVFAVLWIASYFAEALAGWLLWRHRGARPYAHVAIVVFWVQIGLQVLRLLNLVAVRLVPGGVPWSAFGTVALLAVAVAVTMVAAWATSRTASVLLGAVLVWLLVVTAITGVDAILRDGLPLS